MKQSIRKYLLSAVLLLSCITSWGQLRIYTRNYMIQDFKSKPTKVVLDPGLALSASLRQEITSLWSITPYEFCTPADYNKQKDSPECYFLHPETIKGIVFLTLSRGGKKDDNDPLKRPVTMLSMPVAGANDESGRETVYMPAYISLIQDYAEKAINSELAAYNDIASMRKAAPKSLTVYTVPQEADEAFRSNFPDAASLVIISPDGKPKSKPRYEMVIGASDYQLYKYAKH